jgi:hypothetical protein
VEPLQTLETKRKYLTAAVEEDRLLFFVHDPEVPFGRVEKINDRFQLKAERRP